MDGSKLRDHSIAISTLILEVIEDYMKEHKEFSDPTSKDSTMVGCTCLAQTLASWAIASGIPSQKIQELLGFFILPMEATVNDPAAMAELMKELLKEHPELAEQIGLRVDGKGETADIIQLPVNPTKH